jgi:hypothetical protein
LGLRLATDWERALVLEKARGSAMDLVMDLAIARRPEWFAP